MAAFLSRFWLDAKNTDLNDAIKQKQAIIASYSDFEKQFRGTQKRLSLFSGFTANSLLVTPAFGAITAALPSDVDLASFAIDNGALEIKANATTELSAAQFMANLKAQKGLHDISLAQIDSSKDDSGLIIDIKAKWQ
jgi:Tfp pilus assembly protein PilN